MMMETKDSNKLIDNKIYLNDGTTYSIEYRLAKKLNKIAERVTQINPKHDAVIINEGGEGQGKSNASIVEAVYLHQKTKMDMHLFFRLEPLIKFAKDTQNKIIIWDEPSLDSLSTDQLREVNRNLLRLLMTARKKRHIFIINFTKFWKFNEYVIVDRALFMIHIYSKNQTTPGHFMYIKKNNLERLWNGYIKSKQRKYKQLTSFRGKFPNIMEDYFDSFNFSVDTIPNATYDLYESQKTKAIESIGTNGKKSDKNLQRIQGWKYALGQMAMKKIIQIEILASNLKVNPRRLYEWAKLQPDEPILLEN